MIFTIELVVFGLFSVVQPIFEVLFCTLFKKILSRIPYDVHIIPILFCTTKI